MSNIDKQTAEAVAAVVKEQLADAGLPELGSRITDLEGTVKSVTEASEAAVKQSAKLDERFEDFEKAHPQPQSEAGAEQLKAFVEGQLGDAVQAEVAKALSTPFAGKGDEAGDGWQKGLTEYSREQEVMHKNIDVLPPKAALAQAIERIKANESLGVGGNMLTAGVVSADQQAAWNTLIAGNPWLPFITMVGVNSAGYLLPEIKRGTPGMDKNVATAIPAAGHVGGDVTGVTVAVDDYSKFRDMSDTAQEDLPELRNTYSMFLVEDYAYQQATDITAIFKGATSGSGGINAASGRLIKTGAAAALKASGGKITDKLQDMVDVIETQYAMPGSVYMVTRGVRGELVKEVAAMGGMALVPTMNIMAWNGYGLVANDYLDATAANAIVAYFGDFAKAIFCGNRRNLTIEEHDFPGATRLYSRCRYKHSAWDMKGVSALKVAA